MTTTAKVVLVALVAGGAFYLYRKHKGCGCGCGGAAAEPGAAAPAIDDDGPDSELGEYVDQAADAAGRVVLFAREAIGGGSGGCGCGK